MAPTDFGESTRYGAGLYAYVLGVLIVGGSGIVIGAALLWPEIQAWRGPGVAAVAPGIAGSILGFLGVSVLLIGGCAAAYKLIADGVAAGSEAGRGLTPDETASSPADVDEGPRADGEHSDEGPRQPSPSEIAWGTTDASETDDTPAGDGPLPGEDAGSDPLGERSE